MSKPKPGLVQVTDKHLLEFVENDSDFAFEMKVVAELRSLQFECSHSGTYQDPVTEKMRQFDIRASKQHGSYELALAVECKNFRQEAPLLLSSVPRIDTEAFHDVIVRAVTNSYSYVRVNTSMGSLSVYKPGEMVGKKTDQIMYKDGVLSSDDSATFDKLNQAVNSCRDLVQKLVSSTAPPYVKAVVPVVVVPAGRLWQVDYALDGGLVNPPRLVPRATLRIDKFWSTLTTFNQEIEYRLSHLEFLCIDALPDIIGGWLGPNGFFQGY